MNLLRVQEPEPQRPSFGCSDHAPERLDRPGEGAPVDDAGDHLLARAAFSPKGVPFVKGDKRAAR